jgi:hypothetical protein
LPSSFHIQSGLKLGDASLPLLFNIAFGYVVTEVQNNQVGLKLNGTHQRLAYADDVTLQGNDVGIIFS